MGPIPRISTSVTNPCSRMYQSWMEIPWRGWRGPSSQTL
uniref:Uncharacterized protein n=1 Tax=Lepeophtheirus salmonis TaxID=72036 RepID=A0A0K2V3U3_LEPSM